jgi:probable F420-dependent oxidoreductase
VKFCVQYANGDPAWTHNILAPSIMKTWAQIAEASGIDGIAFTDHPAPSGRWVDADGEGVCDPFSALGFCAAVTSRVRLFTYVLVPAYRNPFLMAQQISTLDHLSGGRLTVGMGTGYLRSEFKALGADTVRRAAATAACVEVMKRSWGDSDVALNTPSFEARDTRSLPRVLQRPHPPLWMHANGDWGTEWVAQHGQGWLGLLTTDQMVRTIRTSPLPDLGALGGRLDRLGEACDRNGRSLGDLDIGMGGALPMLDIRRSVTKGPQQSRAYDPDEQQRMVADLEALGVDWVFMTCCGDDPQAAIDSVQEFGERFSTTR